MGRRMGAFVMALQAARATVLIAADEAPATLVGERRQLCDRAGRTEDRGWNRRSSAEAGAAGAGLPGSAAEGAPAGGLGAGIHGSTGATSPGHSARRRARRSRRHCRRGRPADSCSCRDSAAGGDRRGMRAAGQAMTTGVEAPQAGAPWRDALRSLSSARRRRAGRQRASDPSPWVKPNQLDPFRCIADLADRGLGRLNWGGKRSFRGRLGKGGSPRQSRRSFASPK